jgi:hypothetical protein
MFELYMASNSCQNIDMCYYISKLFDIKVGIDFESLVH